MRAIAVLLISLLSFSANSSCKIEVSIRGPIGPSVSDYLARAVEQVKERDCDGILLLINTPGGSLQTTRIIVEQILNSDFPYLCLVAPHGAHAGSAGAIILQACHVAGAMESTNIGAATPIQSTGQDMAEDLRKKVMNDTLSWMDGLTKKNNRNKKFGRDIITEAKAVEASEALKLGGIDYVVKDIDEFLKVSEGRVVNLSGERTVEITKNKRIPFAPDFRFQLLDIVTDPQFAYMIFMGSLALLYFELTHPGVMVPGLVGGIGLIVSLVSFHKLEVSWAGLLLLLLGLVLMIAEAFIPSFGALGIGGIVAFVMGSIFLFDSGVGAPQIHLGLILPTAIGTGLIMMVIAQLVYRTRQLKSVSGTNEFLGQVAEIFFRNGEDSQKGKVKLRGSVWTVSANEELSVGDKVQVEATDGLKLIVKKVKQNENQIKNKTEGNV